MRADSPMHIYWVSRHEPLPAQIEELERLYGKTVQIHQDPRPFSDAYDILHRYNTVPKPREMVVVAPLTVISILLERGLKPLWAEMERVDNLTDPSREVAHNGRVSRFLRFRRIIRCGLEFEEVEQHALP